MKRKIKLFSILFCVFIVVSSCTKTPMACCMLPETGTIGQPITFSSTCSTNASKYKWDFGDGNTSTDANPIHIYLTAGTNTVKLMAMSSNESKMAETSKSIKIQ